VIRLLFAHGWAMQASLWDGLRAALGAELSGSCLLREPGYFSEPLVDPRPECPVLAVGHSLGLLGLLLRPPPHLAGLVSINGFSRFSAAPDHPSGVAPRILRRMRQRLSGAPEQVAVEFRRRCGLPPASGVAAPAPLAAGLDLLEAADGRESLRRLAVPVVALAGAGDRVAPPELSRACFTSPFWLAGGHVLPQTHPADCARAIRCVLERLA